MILGYLEREYLLHRVRHASPADRDFWLVPERQKSLRRRVLTLLRQGLPYVQICRVLNKANTTTGRRARLIVREMMISRRTYANADKAVFKMGSSTVRDGESCDIAVTRLIKTYKIAKLEAAIWRERWLRTGSRHGDFVARYSHEGDYEEVFFKCLSSLEDHFQTRLY